MSENTGDCLINSPKSPITSGRYNYLTGTEPPRNTEILREQIEDSFEDRNIYKDPQLTHEEMREALIKTNRAAIVDNQVCEDRKMAVDTCSRVLVEADKPLEYRRAVTYAYDYYAHHVLVPRGLIKEEDVKDYVRRAVGYTLKHEFAHARSLPEDLLQRDPSIRKYFTIGFYTTCVQTGGNNLKNSLQVTVEDNIAPSLLILSNIGLDNILTPEERIAYLEGPIDNLSKFDRESINALRKSINSAP